MLEEQEATCVKSASAWIASLDEFWVYYIWIRSHPADWDSVPSLWGLSLRGREAGIPGAEPSVNGVEPKGVLGCVLPAYHLYTEGWAGQNKARAVGRGQLLA